MGCGSEGQGCGSESQGLGSESLGWGLGSCDGVWRALHGAKSPKMTQDMGQGTWDLDQIARYGA